MNPFEIWLLTLLHKPSAAPEEDRSVLELTEREKKIVLKMIRRIGFWFAVEKVLLVLIYIALLIFFFFVIFSIFS